MIAIDLFAGSGWGLACQRLNVTEFGVEIMPEARATRVAAHMPLAQWSDVWDVLTKAPVDSPIFQSALQLASPPCQTFSAAGSGAGRRALNDVLGLIADGSYALAASGLRQQAAVYSMDDRTALVLTPLAYAYRHRPKFIALEQVPSVLPVWEAVASELRDLGYSAKTEILNAEQYGVPQTRRRAILVARNDGPEVQLPTPTHSRYHVRDPKRLDAGVKPWISMAEALGWEDPELLFAGAGRTAAQTSGQAQRPMTSPAHTITGGQTATFVLRSNYGTSGDPQNRGERAPDQPAPTITSKAGRMKWVHERPATTISGDARVWPPGHKVNADDIRRLGEDEAREKYGDRAGTEALRLTPEECAVLQTFPHDFPFQGGKSKRHLQIGNAVPPLLAERIIATLTTQ